MNHKSSEAHPNCILHIVCGAPSLFLFWTTWPASDQTWRDVRRRVSFANMCESIPAEQGGADTHPVSPHPVGPQPEPAARTGQPGSTGSPRLLHTPKKSVLRPRGSKACGPEPTPTADVSAPSATSVGFDAVTAASNKGASLTGMPGEDPISFRAKTQTYGCCEGSRESSPVRPGAFPAKGNKEHMRDKPVQDMPATPRSPTALQAKLQRLKIKWSALAERSQPPSDSSDAIKPIIGTGRAPIKNSVPVNVTASASFTIVELDREESANFVSWPGSSKSNTLPVPAASAGEGPSSSHAISVAKADSADGNADREPARSAWEEALGLPAGVNLWGPTVLELPDSAFATRLSETSSSDQASATLQRGLVYVTAPRPVAEAVETESFDESSHLTSPTTATISFSEMRSPDSHTETDSALKAQGVSEEDTSPLTSPALTPSTLTLETASASAPESAKHPLMRAYGEEPMEASLLSFKPDMIQGRAGAASDELQERLTLDQKLSCERVSAHDEASEEAQQQQSPSPSAGMPDGMQNRSAQEPGQYLHEAQLVAANAGGRCRATACNGNVHLCAEQGAAGKDASENEAAELQHTLSEPAALDRGEPTFEDTIRSQEARGNSKRGMQQLLPPGKQAYPGQRAQGSGSPQRSFSPFGRLGCMSRADPDQETSYGKEAMSAQLGTEAETSPCEPKQASESAQGPGPLEKGMHEIELGGYYLTTPDPLRTDPGFARRRRTSSEQSVQCAAQHEQHARDPLNCDSVQYVSSPAWRLNTLTALNKLQPSVDPSEVSGSEAWGQGSITISSLAPIRQMQRQTPCSEQRDQHREHVHRIGHGSRPREMTREGRENARGTASRSSEKMELGLAKMPAGAHHKGSSRAHVKEKTSRGSPPDKRHVHRHVGGYHAGRPPSSDVSAWQPISSPRQRHAISIISWAAFSF